MTSLTQQQKLAWFNLTVTIATLIVVAALIPLIGPSRAQAGFALLSVLAFSPLVARRKRKDEVQNDERETVIRHRAGMITAAVMLLFVIVACNVVMHYYAAQRAVPMDAIGWIAWGAGCIFAMAYGIGVLLQYRGSSHGDE